MEEKRVMDMEIGGMGIINIYSRMLLLLEKDFIFKLSNTVQGAEVIIGAKMEKAND